MNIDKIKTVISQLPQAQQINHLELKEWLQAVSNSDPKRLLWHLDRATGVGGSEIGTLLLEAQGLTPPFGNTGVQLAKQKLFKLAPERPLPHMMTGILLEKPLINAIQGIYGGSRDAFAEKAVNDGNMPYMNGNCDLYWNLNGKRILVDTKVPINAVDDEFVVSESAKIFSYKAQLNHYDLIGESHGIVADKMVIAELDVPIELANSWVSMIKNGSEKNSGVVTQQMISLLANEQPGMRINFIEVEPDLSINLYGKETPIREAIPLVCKDFFNHLIQGEPLPKYLPEPAPLSPEALNMLNDTDVRLGNLRAISEYCEQASGQAQSFIKKYLSENHVELGDYKGHLFNIKQTHDLDTSAALKTLSNYPVDMNDLRQERDLTSITTRDLDAQKAIKVLRQNGLLESCLKAPAYDKSKVSNALEMVGENPADFQKVDISLRKSVAKAAKQKFQELNRLSTDIEEFLAIKDINQQNEQEVKADQNNTIGMMKVS